MKLLGSTLLKLVIIIVLKYSKAALEKNLFSANIIWVNGITLLQYVLLGWLLLVPFLFWWRTQSYRRKEMVALGIIVLLFAVIEGALFYHFKKPALYSYRITKILQDVYVASAFPTITVQPGKGIHNDTLFYKLAPDASFQFECAEYNVNYKTNSAGLRDDETSLQKPALIFLGDSFTMGYGVAQDSAYPQRVEQLTGLKTLNAAISSYGTARELTLLQLLDTTNLQYVFMQYCSNDEEENAVYIKNNFHYQPPPKAFYLQMQVAERWQKQYFPLKNAALFLKYWSNSIQTKKYASLPSEAYYRPLIIADTAVHNFLHILAQTNWSAKKYKLVVLHNDPFITGTDPFIDKCRQLQYSDPTLKNLAAVDFVNVNSTLVKEDYYHFDNHTNTTGNQKIAASISAYLKTAVQKR
jgi:lysophospholipase L1-like esterase